MYARHGERLSLAANGATTFARTNDRLAREAAARITLRSSLPVNRAMPKPCLHTRHSQARTLRIERRARARHRRRQCSIWQGKVGRFTVHREPWGRSQVNALTAISSYARAGHHTAIVGMSRRAHVEENLHSRARAGNRITAHLSRRVTAFSVGLRDLP